MARYAITWGGGGALSLSAAAAVIEAWQAFAGAAPAEIGSILLVSRAGRGVALRCFGVATNPDAGVLTRQLAPFTRATGGYLFTPIVQSFADQARHFSGIGRLTGKLDDGAFFAPSYYKGSSDIIEAPLGRAGALTLAQAVAANGVTAICDAYGGAVRDLDDQATAFVHRSRTSFTIQYYAQWSNPRETAARVAAVERMRPAMQKVASGAAYCNYCDSGIANPERAYWGANANRLKSIKHSYDPTNLFHHAQSISA